LLLDRTLRYIRAFVDNYKEYFFNKSNELLDIKVDENISIPKGVDQPFNQVIEDIEYTRPVDQGTDNTSTIKHTDVVVESNTVNSN
jgi:hypothetical protein